MTRFPALMGTKTTFPRCAYVKFYTAGFRTMSAADDFKQNAKDCMSLARRASNQDSKVILLELAQTWLRLADHAAEVSEHITERHNATAMQPERRWQGGHEQRH